MRKRRKLKKCFYGWFLILLVGSCSIHFLLKQQEVSIHYETIEEQLPKVYKELFSRISNRSEDKRIQEMIVNYKKYPIKLLELLDKNPDTLEFVYAYPRGKEDTQDYDLKRKEIKTVPFLWQWDTRWGYKEYGDDILGFTGCGPTVLSMALSYFKQDVSLTPYALSQQAMKGGYYVENEGTSWNMFEDIASEYDVQCFYTPISKKNITNLLTKNHLIILSMKAGTFTTTGHFILLAALYEDGRVMVHDPNSKTKSEQPWDIEDLIKECSAGWDLYI